jgi:hypothetical protein
MACADVAMTKAKATAINLIILFSCVNLQEKIFLKMPKPSNCRLSSG